MQPTRRQLLIGATAAGGLIAAWQFLPRAPHVPLPPAEGETAFDAWLKIARDGTVTVAVPALEWGQGSATLLPHIAAAELGADWRRVAVEPAPPDPAYANGALAAQWSPMWAPFGITLADDGWYAADWARRHAFTTDAEGTGTAAWEHPLRLAAAQVRVLLCQAAAQRWGGPWEECKVAAGQVRKGSKVLGFGDLAAAAARLSAPSQPPLRAPAAETEVMVPPGAPVLFPRLDAPGKAAGQAVFAGDVRLPDLQFAAIRHAPLGTTLGKLDPRAVTGLGATGLVRSERWVAAVAPSWWLAERALQGLDPAFDGEAVPDTPAIEKALSDALAHGTPTTLATIGSGSVSAKPALARRYTLAPAIHAPLEPASATARLTQGRLEVWAPAQAPGQTRAACARALGLGVGDVTLYPVPAGGSFDLRLECEIAVEAAMIAQEVGKPVQLTWSWAEQQKRTWPRPPALIEVAADLSPEDVPNTWRTRLAIPPAMRQLGERLLGKHGPLKALELTGDAADPLTARDAIPPYRPSSLTVEHVGAQIPLPTGSLVGGAGAAAACFAHECFLDELAPLARSEPLALRMALMGDDARLGQCLQQVAGLAGWNAGSDQSGQGLACHRTGNGAIAVVAIARRGEGGRILVERIHAVADLGRTVNRDLARQQLEAALTYGTGLALGSAARYSNGVPELTRISDLTTPTLADAPQIVVSILDSTAAPADPWSLAVPVAAPAIANALFSSTGQRIRSLPLSGAVA